MITQVGKTYTPAQWAAFDDPLREKLNKVIQDEAVIKNNMPKLVAMANPPDYITNARTKNLWPKMDDEARKLALLRVSMGPKMAANVAIGTSN